MGIVYYLWEVCPEYHVWQTISWMMEFFDILDISTKSKYSEQVLECLFQLDWKNTGCSRINFYELSLRVFRHLLLVSLLIYSSSIAWGLSWCFPISLFTVLDAVAIMWLLHSLFNSQSPLSISEMYSSVLYFDTSIYSKSIISEAMLYFFIRNESASISEPNARHYKIIHHHHQLFLC